MGLTLTSQEQISVVMERVRADIMVAMPATVVSYDPSLQVADLQPQLGAVVNFNPGEDIATETLPVIAECPVLFPGSAFVKQAWPLTAGDSVLVVVCDQSLHRYRSGESVGDEPISTDRHSLDGAVCIPCSLRPESQALQSSVATSDSAVTEYAGGQRLVFHRNGDVDIATNGTINLAGGSDNVALAKETQSAIDALWMHIGLHTHLSTAPGAPTSPASASAPPLTAIKPSVASSQVKVT
jgi:hypothetical protein